MVEKAIPPCAHLFSDFFFNKWIKTRIASNPRNSNADAFVAFRISKGE